MIRSEEKVKETDFLTIITSYERSITPISEALSDVPSEIIIKSRIKYGSKWLACKGIWTEYATNSSIHGIRYIFSIHRPFYEKIFWFVFLLISLCLGIVLIRKTYLKWLDSPVILGFDETLVPIHKIPFPTITICPEIKMNTSQFDFNQISHRFLSQIEGNNELPLSINDITDFASALQICESEVIKRFADQIPHEIVNHVTDTLLDISLDPQETFPICVWNAYNYLCYKIFRYILTDEGVCYQFNALKTEDIYRDSNYIDYVDNFEMDFNDENNLTNYNEITGNWSLDDGYMDQGFNAYPQRSILSSARNGLTVAMLALDRDFDYTCRNFKQGYKIYLNSPESVPIMSQNHILVPHDKEVLVSIIPQYITSADNIRSIESEKRQCYFSDERYLRFYKSYSQSNCQTECLANFTINKCGCAKFWMPKPLDTPICGLTDVDCYGLAAEEMNALIAKQTKQNFIDPQMKILCDCMPACNSLDYNFEISQANLDLFKTLSATRSEYYYTDVRASRLKIYYMESQFTAIKRAIIYDLTTLIAQCGGIFGLFMGISVLSIIEFIYFFTIRLIYNLRKRRYIVKKLMKMENR
ncbi:pickpocket protein 28-like [Cochliomyia hominivorax]